MPEQEQEVVPKCIRLFELSSLLSLSDEHQ
jgi:hypothetical protein